MATSCVNLSQVKHVIHCNPVLETHSAEGDKYIVFSSPVDGSHATVMMNRLKSGDPVRGQCS